MKFDFLKPAELAQRNVLILGLGSFGGGSGCAKALHSIGAKVTISDLRNPEQLQESITALKQYDIPMVLGEHPEHLFAATDVIVVNPAVPNDSPIWELAEKHKCILTTEVNLAIAHSAHVPTIAVTGTHGKSTCVSLLKHLLGKDCLLAGNLGGSFLEQVLEQPEHTRIVVEMSSFQCERLIAPIGWPNIAILTNFAADHLDRHGDLKSYAAAKKRLIKYQDKTNTILVPGSDEQSIKWKEAAKGSWVELDKIKLESFGLTKDDLPFSEPYRMPSLIAALQATYMLNEVISKHSLINYPGLKHRMHHITDQHGRKLIDNGIATHPDPTTAALKNLAGKVVLLAGGKDKNLNLDEILNAARGNTRMYLYGEGGKRLAKKCKSHSIWHEHFPNFAIACKKALSNLERNETLLFSPTFASYDEFNNFSERAQLFLKFAEETPIDSS